MKWTWQVPPQSSGAGRGQENKQIPLKFKLESIGGANAQITSVFMALQMRRGSSCHNTKGSEYERRCKKILPGELSSNTSSTDNGRVNLMKGRPLGKRRVGY